MCLFGRRKQMLEIYRRIGSLESKEYVQSHTLETLEDNIKLLKIICNHVKYKELHESLRNYKEDLEKAELEGYTLAGCINQKQIWVKKEVKNG